MEGSYLSFLPKEIIYDLLYKISVNDITSSFPINLLNIFLAYNQGLKSCYESVVHPVIVKRDFFFGNLVNLCYVLDPNTFNLIFRISAGDWDYFYYTTFSKIIICQQDYFAITACYGPGPGVYNDNSFWKGLVISLLSGFNSYGNSLKSIPRKGVTVIFPDFISYRKVYPVLINLLKIKYILDTGTINGILLLNRRYMEYIDRKIEHEISQLRSIDKDFYKIIIVTFLRNCDPYVLPHMISDIHSLDPVSLEILYHLLHNDKTRSYLEKIYDVNIDLLSRIIVPYISVKTVSPNIGDFYLNPILNSIKGVNNFKHYINGLLTALSTHPQDYDINKIRNLRSFLMV